MYHHVTHETYLWMAMSPFQNEKWLFHKIFFKVNNELTFPFVDAVLYMDFYNYFD